MEFGNVLPYGIKITGSANKGFIVTVGCATCTFTNKTEMLESIGDYIDNPKEVQKAYNTFMQKSNPSYLVTDMGPGGGTVRLGPQREDCQQEDCAPTERRR